MPLAILILLVTTPIFIWTGQIAPNAHTTGTIAALFLAIAATYWAVAKVLNSLVGTKNKPNARE